MFYTVAWITLIIKIGDKVIVSTYTIFLIRFQQQEVNVQNTNNKTHLVIWTITYIYLEIEKKSQHHYKLKSQLQIIIPTLANSNMRWENDFYNCPLITEKMKLGIGKTICQLPFIVYFSILPWQFLCTQKMTLHTLISNVFMK